MTKEQLIKKARYFGANIGNEFVYNETVRIELTGVNFIPEQNKLQIVFDSGSIDFLKVFELPKDIEDFNKFKLYYEKRKRKFGTRKMRKARRQNN